MFVCSAQCSFPKHMPTLFSQGHICFERRRRKYQHVRLAKTSTQALLFPKYKTELFGKVISSAFYNALNLHFFFYFIPTDKINIHFGWVQDTAYLSLIHQRLPCMTAHKEKRVQG